jgi:hypothetical protein
LDIKKIGRIGDIKKGISKRGDYFLKTKEDGKEKDQ